MVAPRVSTQKVRARSAHRKGGVRLSRCLCPSFGYFVSSDTPWQPAVSRVTPIPARPKFTCYQHSTLDQAWGPCVCRGDTEPWDTPPGRGPGPWRRAGLRGSPLLLLLQGKQSGAGEVGTAGTCLP